MNIWLKEISEDDGVEYLNMLNELASYPDVYAKPFKDPIDMDEYASFKQGRIKAKSKEYMESKGKYPVTTYWVMLNGCPVGYALLHHEIDLNSPGGHFGLCLLKSMQNKGIGMVVSDMLSKIAYDTYGLKKVVYTSKEENIQSQRSLEKIGAINYDYHDGYKYYYVDLEEKFKERGK